MILDVTTSDEAVKRITGTKQINEILHLFFGLILLFLL